MLFVNSDKLLIFMILGIDFGTCNSSFAKFYHYDCTTMNLFNDCQRDLEYLIEKIDHLRNQALSMMSKVKDVSFFSLDGLDMKNEWEQINQEFKRLILTIKYRFEELDILTKQNLFRPDEVEKLKALSGLTIAKMQTTSSLIEDTIEILKSNNLLVDLLVFFEDIWSTLKKGIALITKFTLQMGGALLLGGQPTGYLPPSDENY